MDAKSLLAIRKDPKRWFQGFARIRDEETRQPIQPPANILQRRVFEHYRRCQEERKPCRMAVLKYRRAGSSTSGACLVYMHAMNHEARLGLIGTDYKASHNMLEMVTFYGKHDDFPGWAGGAQPADFHEVEWDEKTTKVIATRVEFATKSVVELYTAKNPVAARSAGLNGFHATECGFWATGGRTDAADTLASMRNTLPKKGFHVAIEESTANGAQGSFYDTCQRSRWPEYADWWKQWETDWPLTESEFGRDLQFVFIFAAWFEDSRHVERLTPEQAKRIEQTLDAEPWYEGEKELIKRYAVPRGGVISNQSGGSHQSGTPSAKPPSELITHSPLITDYSQYSQYTLGAEVDATVWEQLAWRRAIIKNVCTRRGLDEFKQEYPSNPREAFLASGSPVFDGVGLMELDMALRNVRGPETGSLSPQPGGVYPQWIPSPAATSGPILIWEQPIEGCRYEVIWDTIENSEVIKGTGERDRNSVLVLRDAYRDKEGRDHKAKVVARVRPPNQWDDGPLSEIVYDLAWYYGLCLIVVENNKGVAALMRLKEKSVSDPSRPAAKLYIQKRWAERAQTFTNQLGFAMDEDSRRVVVSALQDHIRGKPDQEGKPSPLLDCPCPQIVGELKSFVFNNKGRAEAAFGAHDDDVLALGIGLVCLPSATPYVPPALVYAGGAPVARSGGWG